jgi:endosialidase-like protein
MFNGFRPSAWSLILLLLASPLAAQDEPAIVATSSGERVRFVSPANICQIRVRVLGSGGQMLFDSDWKDGNVFDGSAIEGAHRLLVSVKDIDGHVIEREVALAEKSSPTITLLAHDGNNGMVVSTGGDLSFRFGDFLAGKDAEAMRLTPAGDLLIHGAIHADKGIMMPDGTVLMTARAGGAARIAQAPLAPAQKSASAASHLTPHPTFAPAFQFVVGDTGVNVGTTNPAYRLDVTGEINTATQYDIGGTRFVHSFGTLNTFVGSGSGNLTLTGSNNTGLGIGTLGATTAGTGNTATGASALFNDTTGNSNTGNGTGALYSNTGGDENTAVGRLALFGNTVGTDNTAVGTFAMQTNTNGSFNTAAGVNALYGGNGSGNTAIGRNALYSATGANNLALGAGAGIAITNGNNNIDIANPGDPADSGVLRIGESPTRTYIGGISGATTTGAAVGVVIDNNGQLGTISSSRRYKFDIEDMRESTDGLMQLRPVKFRYIAHGTDAPLQYGLIAEEVAEVYPEMVTRNKDGEPESVMYQYLAPMLLNEVQNQRREIEELTTTVQRLLKRVEQLEGHPAAH